jgi:hypothetical protein
MSRDRKDRSPKRQLLPRINLMDDQLLKGSSGLKASYGAYCADSVGRTASGSGDMPFTLPDDDEESSDKGGYEPPDGNLAQYYDLGRHLSGDRTTSTASGGTVEETKSASLTASAKPLDGAPSASDGFGMQAIGNPAQSANGAMTNDALATEKVAGYRPTTLANRTGTFVTTSHAISYNTVNKHVTLNATDDGTSSANHSFDMMRSYDNIRQTMAAMPIMGTGTSAVAEAVMSDSDSGNRRDRDRQNDRDRQEYTTSAAGALARGSDAQDRPTVLGTDTKASALPKMQEISQAIMDQIERSRTDTKKNSMSLTVNLSDGSTLDMRLSWQGNNVKVSFGQDALDMRGDIENGWASLTQDAGNEGLRLEAPRFDSATAQITENSYYA